MLAACQGMPSEAINLQHVDFEQQLFLGVLVM
jgi:hypothetical protein